MNGKVLVAYATKYGSTGEVAEAVGARLRGQGLTVDVEPMKQARPDDGYDAVVVGAPFYVGSLLKEARAWLERQRPALERRPTAVFTLGPASAADDLSESSKQLDRALDKLPWLHPVAADMFIGKFDPGKLRGRDRILTMLPASPLHGMGPHDDRDWVAIDGWTDRLAGSLVRA